MIQNYNPHYRRQNSVDDEVDWAIVIADRVDDSFSSNNDQSPVAGSETDCVATRPFRELQPTDGGVIPTTTYDDVDTSLIKLLINLEQTLRVGIGLSLLCGNPSHKLVEPEVYVETGYSGAAWMALRIRPGETGLSTFTNFPYHAEGSAGVLVYKIESTSHKVAIQWRVPWDSNLYSNYFNLKVYPNTVSANADLYNQMFEYSGPLLAGLREYRTEYGVSLDAYMRESNREATLVVEIDTSGYNAHAPPHLHTGCDYNSNWAGSYCWQECHPVGGWCWVDKYCGYGEDECEIGNPFLCYSSCGE